MGYKIEWINKAEKRLTKDTDKSNAFGPIKNIYSQKNSQYRSEWLIFLQKSRFLIILLNEKGSVDTVKSEVDRNSLPDTPIQIKGLDVSLCRQTSLKLFST
ncbi:hypothetical protein NPIL_580861 [Nephila pilipes]|uniref:Uncharacterized protein n=1 Tax=Nephila pilipes TaxID=299642 RepID=A0A8X6QL35_NEPPI|nr:hypothetical protein NPIL_580861 [Nephila pilipes]